MNLYTLANVYIYYYYCDSNCMDARGTFASPPLSCIPAQQWMCGTHTEGYSEGLQRHVMHWLQKRQIKVDALSMLCSIASVARAAFYLLLLACVLRTHTL